MPPASLRLDLVGTGAGKLLLSKDMAFDLLKGGNSGDESEPFDEFAVGGTGTSLTVDVDVDVNQSEGEEIDARGEDRDAAFDVDSDGNDWNFLNFALCLSESFHEMESRGRSGVNPRTGFLLWSVHKAP